MLSAGLSTYFMLCCNISFNKTFTLSCLFLPRGKKRLKREILHALKIIFFPTTKLSRGQNETNMRNLSTAVLFFCALFNMVNMVHLPQGSLL